jgi:hypothetical protein
MMSCLLHKITLFLTVTIRRVCLSIKFYVQNVSRVIGRSLWTSMLSIRVGTISSKATLSHFLIQHYNTTLGKWHGQCYHCQPSWERSTLKTLSYACIDAASQPLKAEPGIPFLNAATSLWMPLWCLSVTFLLATCQINTVNSCIMSESFCT